MSISKEKLFLSTVLPVNDEQEAARLVAKYLVNDIIPRLKAEDTPVEDIEEYHYGFTELLSDCVKAQLAGVLEARHVKQAINDCWSFPYVGYDLMQYCFATGAFEGTAGLEETVKLVLEQNEQAVHDINNGKTKAIGALVGAVMKRIKADPVEIKALIQQYI